MLNNFAGPGWRARARPARARPAGRNSFFCKLFVSGISANCFWVPGHNQSPNISVPYYLEGVIIEVNERPDLQIHYDTTENKKDFIKKYVDKIFKENISYEYI